MKDLNLKGNPKAGLLESTDSNYSKKKQKQMPKFNANLLDFEDPYTMESPSEE
jgi:hypothetical protein